MEQDLEEENLILMTNKIYLGQFRNHYFWAGIPRTILTASGRAGANYSYSHTCVEELVCIAHMVELVWYSSYCRASANYLYSHAGEPKSGQAWKCTNSSVPTLVFDNKTKKY